jgi:hypothetical protein
LVTRQYADADAKSSSVRDLTRNTSANCSIFIDDIAFETRTAANDGRGLRQDASIE